MLGEENEFLMFLLSLRAFFRKVFLDEFDVNGKKDALTHNQFIIIYNINLIGRCTLTDIENLVPTSKSSLSIALSKLEKQGYIERTYPGPNEDRRLVYFEITEKAKQEIEKNLKIILSKYDIFYEKLDIHAKNDLKLAIKTFNKIFEEELKQGVM